MALEDEVQDPNQELNIPENNPDISSEIDRATFLDPEDEGASPEDLASVERLIAGQTPSGLLGDPGTSSLFPGLNQPIQVGQQSGSIIGSQPIFVSRGGPAPVGVIAGRQKALEDAAQKKAAAQKPFDIRKGPIVEDARFQKTLNTLFESNRETYVQKAKDQYGENWQTALMSQETKLGREFVDAMSGLDVLAREGDQIVALFAEVDEAKKSGDLILADETLELFNEFETLSGDLEGGDITKLVNLKDRLNLLKGSISLDKHLNKNSFITKMQGRLVEKAGVKDYGEYLRITESGTLSFKDDIAVMAKGLKRDEFKSSPMTEAQIAERLGAVMGGKKTKSIKVSQKKKGSGGGFDVSPDKLSVSDGDRKIKLTSTEEGVEGSEVTSTLHVPLGTPEKANKTFNLVGAELVDVESGETSVMEGTLNMQPVGLDIITLKDGSKKQVVTVKVFTKVPIKQFGQETGKFKTVEETKMLDYNKSKDRLKTEIPNATEFFDEQSKGKLESGGAADNL
ncbi:MAG: hypothetical protein COA88_14680 [Kordia sp.]|nr:MAG: hypothetical protein COA88_14680 [Kordia sp.]